MSDPKDLPRPWPFMSPIPMMPRPDAGPLCECRVPTDSKVSQSELQTGICDNCGRPFV